MNAVDIVLLILIAAAFITAMAVCIRNRKKGGGCSGCCADCRGCAYRNDRH